MARRAALLALIAMLLSAAASPAFAHKLRVFATAVGATIEGRVYFVGGTVAVDVPVVVYSSAGAVAGETLTVAPDGAFTIPVSVRDSYRITADARDGHVAEFRLAASRFPESLPAAPDVTAPPATLAEPPAPEPAAADAALIEEAIGRQLAPLLEELDALRQTLGFRDMLGTSGIILGIFGAWALIASRRRKP